MVSDIACYGNCAVISQCTEGLGWFRVEGVGQKVLFSYFAVRFCFHSFHLFTLILSSSLLSLSLSSSSAGLAVLPSSLSFLRIVLSVLASLSISPLSFLSFLLLSFPPEKENERTASSSWFITDHQ